MHQGIFLLQNLPVPSRDIIFHDYKKPNDQFETAIESSSLSLYLIPALFLSYDLTFAYVVYHLSVVYYSLSRAAQHH